MFLDISPLRGRLDPDRVWTNIKTQKTRLALISFHDLPLVARSHIINHIISQYIYSTVIYPNCFLPCSRPLIVTANDVGVSSRPFPSLA